MKKCLSNLTYYIGILILAINLHISSAKAVAFDEITDLLSTLTCETEGAHNLLMEPFTHSCIQDDYMTMYVSSIISGGIHTSVMTRLRMDDENILPGNCLRKNRADPNNPSISFGLCSNLMMIGYRAELIGLSLFASLTGNNPWEHIKDMVDSSKYTMMFNDKHDGDWGLFFDVGIGPTGLPPIFPWIVEERSDRICLSTIGATIIAGTWLHVGCKYIGEPFPESIYKSFFRNTGLDPDLVPPEMVQYMNCATAGGCAARALAFSQAPITISGTIMECVREMITKMLISKDVCVTGNFSSTGQISSADSSFYQFQRNMQRAVMAFLTLYVMSVGFKILMGGADNIPKSGELFMHIVKFMLVIYFSVGMNFSGGGAKFDGMVSFVFPIILNAGAEIATWVSNATPSGLCRFLPSEYPTGMGYLAIWDALDCKVLHYIGIDSLMTLFTQEGGIDPLSFKIPPYVYLLIPAIITKKINLVLMIITYPLLVLSLAAFLVNAFTVCLIAAAILGILAPIFVPMALFDFTKGYFQSWYVLMISFILQPVVVVGFMTLMFSLFDVGFYGSCKYKGYTIKQTGANGETLSKKLFVVDNNWSNYDGGRRGEEYKNCVESIGYLFNSPLSGLAAHAEDAVDKAVITIDESPESQKNMEDYIKEFDILNGVHEVFGFFFGYFEYIANNLLKMILNMLICCLLIYLMYELSNQLGEIAADLAQSVTLSGAIAPRTVLDGSKKLIGKAASAAAAASGDAAAADSGDAGGDGNDVSMDKGPAENEDVSMDKKRGGGSDSAPSMDKKPPAGGAG